MGWVTAVVYAVTVDSVADGREFPAQSGVAEEC